MPVDEGDKDTKGVWSGGHDNLNNIDFRKSDMKRIISWKTGEGFIIHDCYDLLLQYTTWQPPS